MQQYQGNTNSIQYPSAPAQTQTGRATQDVRFYKSSLLFFGSAPGRMQRDFLKMQREGWKLIHVAYLGVDYLLRKTIVAVYERY